jgi:hypothetical protein
MVSHEASQDLDSLVSRWELQVDADTAILATVRGGRSGAGGHNVFVKGNVKDGTRGIDVDIGVTRRTARANGSDVEDLNRARRRRSGHERRGSAGCPGKEEETGEETHLEAV